jgi:citrate lyase beta subunit
MIRINGLDTHYICRDVIDNVEACERLDIILVPKVGVAADVDAVGYRSAARRAAVLGYERKRAIHPSRISLANEDFTPSQAQVDKAHPIMAAMEAAARAGLGAVSLNGRRSIH